MAIILRAPPTRFWIIAWLLLLWNALGCVAYWQNVTGDTAARDAATQALYEATPLWATAAFAIAVWGGLAASVALLLRRSAARLLFLVSFLALVAQNVYLFFLSDVMSALGPLSMIMPVLAMIVGLAALWFARRAATRGWLK